MRFKFEFVGRPDPIKIHWIRDFVFFLFHSFSFSFRQRNIQHSVRKSNFECVEWNTKFFVLNFSKSVARSFVFFFSFTLCVQYGVCVPVHRVCVQNIIIIRFGVCSWHSWYINRNKRNMVRANVKIIHSLKQQRRNRMWIKMVLRWMSVDISLSLSLNEREKKRENANETTRKTMHLKRT